eukprot:TRINITY_DN113592_c0_g1_i1.p1 TRINITY_DN113592_c0_g1~~TRINITY_DN113592_c0_g1_i1.p1  ORF type:complete len:209 (-),score=40.38 TRINITY_DN113592_c0_g1_i1:25-651(-)
MTTSSYCVRPLFHLAFLALTFSLVAYPFYLIGKTGILTKGDASCVWYYGQWAVCALSHVVLWFGVLAMQLALYPVRIERDDALMEFRLVLLAVTLPCPYEQVKSVKVHSYLPCYVTVSTSIGSMILNPSCGAAAFVTEFEDAKLKTSPHYGAMGQSNRATAAAIAAVRRASGVSGVDPELLHQLAAEATKRQGSIATGPRDSVGSSAI